MKKIILLATLFCSQLFAEPVNTNYVKITEIKAWPDQIDIYLEADHQCSTRKHLKRFLLDRKEDQYFSLLLMAFASGKSANLNYTCNSGGYPAIRGVRVK